MLADSLEDAAATAKAAAVSTSVALYAVSRYACSRGEKLCMDKR